MPDPATPIRPASPRRRRRLRRWIVRIVLALVALAAAGAIVYAWTPEPVEVEVATLQRTPLEVIVEGDGKTRVRERYVVTAPISGMLDRVELDPGDAVTADQVLARVRPPDAPILDERSRSAARARLAAAIAQQHRAETAMQRARATYEVASKEATRVRGLVRAGALAGADLERAALDEEVARTEVAAAAELRTVAAADIVAARAALGIDVAPSTERVAITAPIPGVVLRVVRDSAGPVAAATPLLELGNPCDLEAVLEILSNDAAQIPPGAQVSVEEWGGPPLRGTVRRVEPSAFTQVSALGIEEQRVNVIVALVDAPARLGDAFRVEGRVTIWRGENVPTIPTGALFRDDRRWAVYVLEGNVARLRHVEVGHRGRHDVEILQGLPTGARVILHPGDRVRDGRRVVIR